MLASSGFSDDPLFAHSQGQERLTESIVDFVRTGVVQILTLQPNAWTTIVATVMSGQSLGFIKRGSSTHIGFEEVVEFPRERWVCPGFSCRLLQLRQSWHECFWNVLATKASKTSMGAWAGRRLEAGGIRLGGFRQSAGHGSRSKRWVSVSRQSRDDVSRKL
jgi:hypothetical protein